MTHSFSYWLSSEKMTVGVSTDENKIITEAAPIVRKFIGQPVSNLVKWMRKQGGFKMRKLNYRGPQWVLDKSDPVDK